MSKIFDIQINCSPYLIYPLFVLLSLVVVYLFYAFIKKYLGHLAKISENKTYDLLFSFLCRNYKYFAIIFLLFVVSIAFPIPGYYRGIIDKVVSVSIIILVLVLSVRLIFSWFDQKAEREPEIAKITKPVKNLVSFLAVVLGVLLVLDNLGFSLTAVWTTLGIGSLAVAFALKDTVANFFSGIYIILDKSVLPGDFIKLSSGEEGVVLEIGWRSTRINTIQGNMVVVPNSKLIESIITNYNKPDSSMSVLIEITVSYENDPYEIERILYDEASKGVKEIEGAVADVPPIIRFLPGMGEYGLKFTVIVRAKSFVEQYYLRHEMQKRIFKRLKEENIKIPYPTQIVYIKRE